MNNKLTKTNWVSALFKSFERASYNRTASELLQFSDSRLKEANLSSAKLALGYEGLPWSLNDKSEARSV